MIQRRNNFALLLTVVFSLLMIGQFQHQQATAQLFDVIHSRRQPDRIIWSTPSRLTLSFAADGTDISGHDSTLFSSFSSILNPTEIEDLVIEAFQRWAELSSINVGIVDDDISIPFGTSGPTQTNFAIGDIRVGAVPMAGDVFAVAVSHTELLSGGWSGTLLFNSNAKIASSEQFFAVALHEAGHVFGLEHTNNENAVMHPTALNAEFDPEDIEKIQSLYGTRVLDQYDSGGESNNDEDSAVSIRNNGSINGSVPTIAFGDISGPSDVDYFEVDLNGDNVVPIRFRLLNKGISTADLMISVTDEDGTDYGIAVGTGGLGDELEVIVDNPVEGLDYIVRIELAPDSRYSVGTYALVTIFDGPNLEMESLNYIDRIIRRNYNFVEQDQIQELFCQDEPFCDGLVDIGLNDELKGPSNDTFATARVLEPLIAFEDGNRFQILGSLQTNIVDVDHYRIASPDDCSNLTVSVTALEMGGPIVDLTLYDASQNELEGRTFVNGNGELLIQYSDIKPNTDYVVRLEADDPDVFGTGNYQLDMAFCTPRVRIRNLAAGLITPTNIVKKHSLYVARSQLFHFALRTNLIFGNSIPTQLQNSTVWMSIINEDGDVVHRIATKLGELRSSRSVVLRPGSYAVRVNFTRPSTPEMSRSFFGLQYVIEGEGISDPTGPEVIDAADDPFAPCDKLSNEFCYPNGEMSADPFIIVDGEGFKPIDPPSNPLWEDANIWYWAIDWLG